MRNWIGRGPAVTPNQGQKYLTNTSLISNNTKKDKRTGMDGEAIFFTGRGGAGNPPFPIMRDGAGKGSKSAGLEGPRRGTYCVYQLIEIKCCSKENLNLHCIK